MLEGYRNYIATQGFSSSYVGEDEFNSRTERLLQELNSRRSDKKERVTHRATLSRDNDDRSLYELARDVQELRYDVRKMEHTLEDSKIVFRTELGTVKKEIEDKLSATIHRIVDEGIIRAMKEHHQSAPFGLPHPPHKEATSISSEVSNLRMKVLEQEMASLTQRITEVSLGTYASRSGKSNVFNNLPGSDLSAVVDLLQQQVASSKASRSVHDTATRRTDDNDATDYQLNRSGKLTTATPSDQPIDPLFMNQTDTRHSSDRSDQKPPTDSDDLPGFGSFLNESRNDFVDVVKQVSSLQAGSRKHSKDNNSDESNSNQPPQALKVDSTNSSLANDRDPPSRPPSAEDENMSSKIDSKVEHIPASRSSIADVSVCSVTQNDNIDRVENVSPPMLKMRSSFSSSSDGTPEPVKRRLIDTPPLLQMGLADEGRESDNSIEKIPKLKNSDSHSDGFGSRYSHSVASDAPASKHESPPPSPPVPKADSDQEQIPSHLKKTSPTPSIESDQKPAEQQQPVATSIAAEFDEYSDMHLLGGVSTQMKRSDSSSSSEEPAFVRKKKPASRGTRKMNFFGGGTLKAASKPASRTNKMLFSDDTNTLPVPAAAPMAETEEESDDTNVGKASAFGAPVARNITKKIFDSDSDHISEAEGVFAGKATAAADDDFDFDELDNAPTAAAAAPIAAPTAVLTKPTTVTTTVLKGSRDYDDDFDDDGDFEVPASKPKEERSVKQVPTDPFGDDSDFSDGAGFTGGNAWGGL